ncbi:hypothetical protein GGX14DRAFT_559645 [Mycena pura]|uniref:Uncharacterized protein n=1 Tax=Mycena pura TaxID=153505 RepID=A0AAD6VX29_9AGAR|nr:hypothetical protein GGX14DRAFT_559645 [Mycena pura]
MVKDEHQLRFDELTRILDGAETTADEFLAAVDALYREYEELRGWISWWLLPANASMVFRTIQLMSPELQQRISSSTNAAESSHNQLYAAAGKNHDLVEGCRHLFLVQSQVEAHYKAVIAGNVQAKFQGLEPRAASRIKPYYQSDGPPDTRQCLEESWAAAAAGSRVGVAGELISRRVVFAGGQNDAALTAKWKASTMASNCKPEQLEKKFAMFKRRHTTYIDLHPPAILRLLAAQPPPRPPSSTPMSKAGDSRPIAQGPAQAAPARAVISVKPRPLPKKSTLEPGKKGNELVDRVSSAPQRNRAAAPSQAPKRKRVRFDELDPESEDSLKPLPRKMPRKVNVETEVQHRKQPARRGGRATK